MASDDKKTSPAPKNGAVEKKRSLRKKTRANRRTRRRQMPTDRRLRAVRKLPTHPQFTVGARAKNRFRKHIGITGTLFLGTRKIRSDNEPMDGKQPSRQIAKASLSRKPSGLICLVLLSESGRRSIQSLINGAGFAVSPLLGRIFYLLLKILPDHENLQVLAVYDRSSV